MCTARDGGRLGPHWVDLVESAGARCFLSLDGDGVNAAEDCDDTEPTVSSDAPQVCDGLHNDCDGENDNDAADAGGWYVDLDGARFWDSGSSVLACEVSSGTVADATDCDAVADTVYPVADEFCDGDPDNEQLAPSGLSATSEAAKETADPFLMEAVARVHTHRTIDERYELIEVLGRGGGGMVVRARDRILDREVAVKRLSLSGPQEQRSIARFVREAHIMARLEHPNIVTVHDLHQDAAGRLYLSMKLVKGMPVHRAHAAGRLVETRDVLSLMVKMCDAVAFAHAHGIVHRDIKPANVVMGDFGEAYLVDWGIARLLNTTALNDAMQPLHDGLSGLTGHGAITGTVSCMAPEQARGEEDQGPPVDVFGLGALMFFLLTGQRVRPRGETSELFHQARTEPIDLHALRALPRDIRAVLARALAFDVAHRYPDVLGLRADLNALLGGLPVSARRYGPLARVQMWLHRRRRPVMRALVAALLVGVLGVMGGLRYIHDLSAARDESALQEVRALLGQGRATWVLGQIGVAEAIFADARRKLSDLEQDTERVRFALAVVASEARQPILTLTHADGPAAFHPDGDRVVYVDQDTLRVIGLPGGGMLAHRQLPSCVVEDGAERHLEPLFVGEQPGVIWVRGSTLQWIPMTGAVESLALSAQARMVRASAGAVAVLFEDGQVRAWALPDLTPLPSYVSGQRELVGVSRDGQRVLVRDAEDERLTGSTPFQLLRLADGEVLGTAPFGNGNTDDDLTRLMTVHREHVLITPLDDAGAPILIPGEHLKWARLSRDGARLVRWTLDGDMETWDVTGEPQLESTVGAGLERSSIDMDRSGTLMMIRSSRGIDLYDTLGTGPISWLPISNETGDVEETLDIAHSPDRHLVAASSLQGMVRVWDRRTGRLLWSVHTTDQGTRALEFSPDGRFLATADRDGWSRVYDLETGALAWTLDHPGDVVIDVVWWRGGLVQTGSDGTVQFGNAAGTRKHLFEETGGTPWSLAVLADDQVAWTCKGDCPHLGLYDGESYVGHNVPDAIDNTFALCALEEGAVIGTTNGDIFWWNGSALTSLRGVTGGLQGAVTTCAVDGDRVALQGVGMEVTVFSSTDWDVLGLVTALPGGVLTWADEGVLVVAEGADLRIYDLHLYTRLSSARTDVLGRMTPDERARTVSQLCALRGAWHCASPDYARSPVERGALLSMQGEVVRATEVFREAEGPTAALWRQALASERAPR